MSLKYELSEASSSDAQAIASLFALSWTSPFTQLQFGNVDPPVLAANMAPHIAEHMKKSAIKFIVARHPKTQKIVAVAQWDLPPANDGEESTKVMTDPEKDEILQFEDEVYRKKLPETSNKALIMEFSRGLRILKEELLKGQFHYRLENVVTHPDYRGKGLASALISYVFPQADELGAIVYLETASDNPAMVLYKRLEFQEKGTWTCDDLSKFGGEGCHTHVALIRYPSGGN